jgi:flavin reductase (DIM6/NTAB) family NADH-FMN oxidoreductase RutF
MHDFRLKDFELKEEAPVPPMNKRSVKPSRPVYPSPAALVTSVSAAGRPNIITLGEVFNISIFSPVIVGIAIGKPRYSHELISATREFVVNLPTSAMARAVDQCGTVSGRKVDKFAEFGLTPVPAEKVRPPLIAECPVSIECVVIRIQEVGDHDLFLGEAVAQHVAEEALDENGRVLVDKLDPLCFMHWEYWSCARKVGHVGFSRR